MTKDKLIELLQLCKNDDIWFKIDDSIFSDDYAWIAFEGCGAPIDTILYLYDDMIFCDYDEVADHVCNKLCDGMTWDESEKFVDKYIADNIEKKNVVLIELSY